MGWINCSCNVLKNNFEYTLGQIYSINCCNNFPFHFVAKKRTSFECKAMSDHDYLTISEDFSLLFPRTRNNIIAMQTKHIVNTHTHTHTHTLIQIDRQTGSTHVNMSVLHCIKNAFKYYYYKFYIFVFQQTPFADNLNKHNRK